MSNIRLNTPNDIELFLRILAEESVKEAQATISNSDPMQDKIITQMKSDKSVYNISEQPAPGDQDIVTAEDEPEGGGTQAQAEPSQEEPETDESEVSPDVGYSLDSIRDSIKNLRSGLSVDDRIPANHLQAFRCQVHQKRNLSLLLKQKQRLLLAHQRQARNGKKKKKRQMLEQLPRQFVWASSRECQK